MFVDGYYHLGQIAEGLGGLGKHVGSSIRGETAQSIEQRPEVVVAAVILNGGCKLSRGLRNAVGPGGWHGYLS
jgi:hypothetical protein